MVGMPLHFDFKIETHKEILFSYSPLFLAPSSYWPSLPGAVKPVPDTGGRGYLLEVTPF